MANANVGQDQLNLALNESHRRILNNYSRSIGICDGSNKADLRRWLKGIDHAFENTQAGNALIIEMVGYLVGGTLAQQTRRITVALVGAARTWPAVKTRIEEQFLGAEETEMLQDEVERITQQPFEEAREYGNRFLEGVDRAYDPAQLNNNVLMNGRLKKAFINGLCSDQLREQVFMSTPADLETAVTTATTKAHALGQSVSRRTQVVAAIHTPGEEKEDRKDTETAHILKAVQKESKANAQNTTAILNMMRGQAGQSTSTTSNSNTARLEGGQTPLQHPTMVVASTEMTTTEEHRGGRSTKKCPYGCKDAPVINQYYYGTGYNGPAGRGGGRPQDNRAPGTPSASAAQGRSQDGCWLCGKMGHMRRDCTSKPTNGQQRGGIQGAIEMLTAIEAQGDYAQQAGASAHQNN